MAPLLGRALAVEHLRLPLSQPEVQLVPRAEGGAWGVPGALISGPRLGLDPRSRPLAGGRAEGVLAVPGRVPGAPDAREEGARRPGTAAVCARRATDGVRARADDVTARAALWGGAGREPGEGRPDAIFGGGAGAGWTLGGGCERRRGDSTRATEDAAGRPRRRPSLVTAASPLRRPLCPLCARARGLRC